MELKIILENPEGVPLEWQAKWSRQQKTRLRSCSPKASTSTILLLNRYEIYFSIKLYSFTSESNVLNGKREVILRAYKKRQQIRPSNIKRHTRAFIRRIEGVKRAVTHSAAELNPDHENLISEFKAKIECPESPSQRTERKMILRISKKM